MHAFINKVYTYVRTSVYLLLAIVTLATVTTSCKSTKSKMFKNTPNYKATPSAVTKRLFMQYKRANVVLPPKEDGSEGDAGTITEKVNYKNEERAEGVVENLEGNSEMTNKVHTLEAVQVVGKSRSTPERDGIITVQFNVVVPKELMSTDWRVVLTPKLLHNDSIVPLEKLVLNGQKFVDKQTSDYEEYDAFLKTLVAEEDYDSAYFDLKGTQQDMKERQNIYWQAYSKEWRHLVEFERWLVEKGNKDAYGLAKDESYRLTKLHEHSRNAMKESVILMVQNKDTTGVYEKHMQKYDKETAKIFEKQTGQDYDIKSIPAKFRDLYNSPYSLDDLTNFNFTEQDSLDIAKHRFNFEAIVFNEMDIARKEDIFDNMVTFPHFDDPKEFRVDSVLTDQPMGLEDYVYTYSQDYPVVAGLKSIRITMDGRIQAADRSTFNLPKTDTLAYYISSLVQLADTSLIYKKTKLYRNMFDRQTVLTQYKGRSPIFDDKFGNNAKEIEKVLDPLRTYQGLGNLTIDSITLHLTTSLEGDYTENEELAGKRASSLIDYLSRSLGGVLNLEPLMKLDIRGEDWGGLVSNIRKRNDMPNKNEIVTMLTTATHPDATEDEVKKKFPQDYKIMKDSIYPLLNKAVFDIDLHRSGQETNDSISVEYRADYEEGIRLLLEREYFDAIEILANYPDVNAALCLLCMGYNQKAEDLLKELDQTDRTEYLYAVLTARMGRDTEAIQHLKKACELNPSWVYRVNLDPDVSKLVKKYDLMKDLDADDTPSITEGLDPEDIGDAPAQ